MNGNLLLNIEILENEAINEKVNLLISQERKGKIDHMKSQKPARLSLGAGLLTHIALEKCGLTDKINNIEYGQHGKPYLPNSDFHFNLSHSGNHVVCVYSDEPVGVDLQRVKEDLPKHTKKILSDDETLYLNSLEAHEQIVDFYRLWSRKESLIKWDGRGLRISLSEVSVTKNKKINNEITFEGDLLYFKEIDFLLPKYTFCICSKKKNFPSMIQEITAEFLTKY